MTAHAGLQYWPAASLTFPFASGSSRLQISVAYCPVSTVQRFKSHRGMNMTQIPLSLATLRHLGCVRGDTKLARLQLEASAEVSNK